jgi:hypothetical protein
MKGGIRHARKLLIASIGVAAVNYVQCGGETGTGTAGKDAGKDTQGYDVVANLVAPDTGFDAVANLVAPDAGDDNNVFDVVANLVAPDAADDGTSIFDVVANLVAPDAGSD